MPRNMSFMLTTAQIRDRTKTVTRRLGWHTIKRGDKLVACKKCMGLKKGETVERLATLHVIDVRHEPLDTLLSDPHYGAVELSREGFPGMTPSEFVRMFCQHNNGCGPGVMVTRIEFVYVEDDAPCT